MKKAIVLLLVCSLMLCGISIPVSSADTIKYADQTAFLRDMAEGITLRLNDNRDSSPMTEEEKASFYLAIVGYELDRIEKYETQVFEDSVFNDLAHLYIDACQTQRFAAQNYKNKALYDALWQGAKKTRSAIIVELYSRYDLPITAEQAAKYAPSTSYTISYSSGSTNEQVDYTDCLSVEPISPGWNEHYSNADYYHYDLLVTNEKADCDLSVTIRVDFYDSNGKVIGTASDSVGPIGKGETLYCERLKTDSMFAYAKYEITNAEQSYYLSAIKDVKFNVSKPNNKIIIEATNIGEKTIQQGSAYCVFFRGDTIVDADYAHFADHLKPGETQYGECSTKKTYTHYEIYINYCYYIMD